MMHGTMSLKFYEHNRAVTQEILHSLPNPQSHCRIPKNLPMVPNQNWTYPAHTHPHRYVKM